MNRFRMISPCMRAAARPIPGKRAAVARFVCLLIILSYPGTARAAGTLCGTVRDSLSHAPIARAGIALLFPNGAPTGLAGITDSLGKFCIDSIPPSTYVVEVVVRDHRRTQREVIVLDDVAEVDLNVPPGPVILLRLSANPARERVSFSIVLPRASPCRLTVFDAAGRWICGWSEGRLPAGPHEIAWDFRDDHGHEVPSGWYLAQLSGCGTVTVRPFVRLR